MAIPAPTRLVLSPSPATSEPTPARKLTRFFKFAVVGGSGVIVNLTVFQLCYALLASAPPDPRLLLSNSAGIVVSIFTNFLLNDRWTWGDRVKGHQRAAWAKRLARYYATCSIAACIQLAVSWSIHRYLLSSLHWLTVFKHDLRPGLAALCGIAAGIAINFPLSHLWTFKDEHPGPPQDVA
jgi:putative flippase GtrA